MSKKAVTQSKPAVVQPPAKNTTSGSKSAVKEQPPKPSVAKGAFDPAGYAKNGVTEEQVT